MKTLHVFLLLLSVLLFWPGGVLAQTVPSGRAISLEEIIALSENLGGFLMILGGILAMITIIGSGIYYLTAGSNPQSVGTAKGILKAGIIGALIIFGAGIIIATVRGVAEDPLQFFGGGSGGGSSGYCINGVCAGHAITCSTNYDCPPAP